MDNDNVETNAGEMTLDEMESAVNALIDETGQSGDNADSGASSEAEKALVGMSERLDALESENSRLTAMVGKMITAYGARLTEPDTAQGVEAFPSTVEKQFDQPTGAVIPSLSDIVLGS